VSKAGFTEEARALAFEKGILLSAERVGIVLDLLFKYIYITLL